MVLTFNTDEEKLPAVFLTMDEWHPLITSEISERTYILPPPMTPNAQPVILCDLVYAVINPYSENTEELLNLFRKNMLPVPTDPDNSARWGRDTVPEGSLAQYYDFEPYFNCEHGAFAYALGSDSAVELLIDQYVNRMITSEQLMTYLEIRAKELSTIE